jgi:4-hydroxy-tetrahydrodipicolinate reductase
MIKVAICGSCGKMGRLVVREVSKQRDMKVVAAIEAPNTPYLGQDVGEIAGVGKLDVLVVGAERLEEVLKQTKPDVMVDFTTADAAVQNIKTAAKQGVSIVVGTTGFSPVQRDEIRDAIRERGIRALIAPNMSVGVNVFFKMVEEAAKLLGKEYDVEIVEIHHSQKIDSPSGTALRAAEIIAEAMGHDKEVIKCGRAAGKQPRAKGEIFVHSVRAGDVVGEHIVIFAAPGERVEIVHRAHSRETFAAGVIRAIRHVLSMGKPGEIQDMRDVLGLR